MSAAVVGGIAPDTTTDFVVLTSGLAIIAGIVLIVAGFLRLGRIAQFFSESVVTGFVFGLALVIAIKQVPKIIGIKGGDGDFFVRLWHILLHLGDTHGGTILVGITCLSMMVVLEHRMRRLPAALLVLVFGIVVSSLLDLKEHGVKVVGKIDGGLAAPRIPELSWHDVTLLFGGGIGLAIVIFAESIGPARVFASKHHTTLDPNQELIGFGAANIGAGIFQGFPIGGSLSKSVANDMAHAHSQLSAIVAAILTILAALFLTPLFTNLPEAALGAIVVVEVSGMMKVGELRRLARLRRSDFVPGMVALFGVLVFDVLRGLLIAVVASIGMVIWRASQPKLSVLGRKLETLQFAEIGREDATLAIPGLLIMRPEEGIFFANAAPLHEEIVRRVRSADTPPVALLLDLQSTTDLDIPGADMIGELNDVLARDGITLHLCHLHEQARALLDHSGVTDRIGLQHIHPRVIAGVVSFLQSTGSMDDDTWEMVNDGLQISRRVVAEIAASKVGEDRSRLDRIAEELERLSSDAKRASLAGSVPGSDSQ